MALKSSNNRNGMNKHNFYQMLYIYIRMQFSCNLPSFIDLGLLVWDPSTTATGRAILYLQRWHQLTLKIPYNFCAQILHKSAAGLISSLCSSNLVPDSVIVSIYSDYCDVSWRPPMNLLPLVDFLSHIYSCFPFSVLSLSLWTIGPSEFNHW